jgi:amino acid adenylation domain-containing protein
MSGAENKMNLPAAEKRALLAELLRKKAAKTRQVPLSFSQQRLWFLDQLDPGSPSFNISQAVRLKGELDLQALNQTLNTIVARHESLRTNFTAVEGEPTQIIAPAREIEIQLLDLGELPQEERVSEARRLASEASLRGFNLEQDHLLRASLLKLDDQDQVLLLVMHHIVSDGWSMGVLIRELGDLYEAFSNSRPPSLPELPIQYGDFARWQREWLQGEALNKQVDFWKQQLAGAPAMLELPTDKSRPVIQTFSGAYHTSAVGKELTESLKELSRRERVTLFMTLLAAFQTMLYRYANQDDILIGTPIANRTSTETEGLIGLFVNMLVMRTDLSGNPTFRELLGRVREIALDAFAHQDLPFDKLVEELQPERSLSHAPMFQALFALQNVPKTTWKLSALELQEFSYPKRTSKLDLSLYVGERANGLALSFEYSTDLFHAATIEGMAGHFQTLLEGIVANPEQRIAELPLLTAPERSQLLIEWNDTEVDYRGDKCIHTLFEDQVERTRDKVALISETGRLTYGELNQRANQLAHYLKRRGVGPEVLVGICVERSLEMVVGLLAILKAGGAYVPLDPSYPAERISFMLTDSRARFLLTQQHLSDSLATCGGQTICLGSEWPKIARDSEENPTDAVSAENAAYVLYTSGSTGQPKGVVSAHRTSVNRFEWMWRVYPFAEGEVCCQKTALSFADSIWEIFGPLLQGVPLVIIPDEAVKDPQRFITALSSKGVTRLVLVPSLLRVMLELEEDLAQQLGTLRYCVCSGETLPVELATMFRKQVPHAKLINLYGSSEVAADVLCYEVERTAGLATIPLGRPIANTSAYVLDANFQPAPVGVRGEICIGGEGLARGYLNQATLTAEKFVPDPFSVEDGARLFRTGDIGRHLADGNIEYHGRRDHQVKVRGFRIELGEIEVQLASHPRVHEAIVIASDNERGDKQLVAYVVASGAAPAVHELRAYLSRKLPEYMIPPAFVFLEALPLTTSGKVNRLALPHPTSAQLVTRNEFLAPQTPTEEILAGIWTDVLNVADIGVNDDFFGLGGHSLLLARVTARIRESFNMDLPLRALFEAPTIATLAERVETTTRADEAVPAIATSRERAPTLSFAQERLWFFDQFEPDSGAYNIPRMFRLQGPLDVAALQKSVDEIVSRHEVLRTSFINDNGKPALSIAEHAAVEIQLIDLRSSDKQVQELAAHEAQRPFDLARGPLLRISLLQLGSDEHVLLLTIHHIISDAWSIGVFLRELSACYNAFSSGASPELPPLALQYVDFAIWQREWLRGPALQRQLDYWRQTLASAPPVINLPTDRPRPELRSFRGARHSLVIDNETTGKLKTVARGANATLFMTLLTAFQSLLACVTNANDVVVGSPTAGRNQPETESLIGYFVNTIILRAQFSGDPTFRESVSRTRAAAIGAFANQDVPFEKLVDELKPERAANYNPLFQVWFVLQNAQIEREELRGLSIQPLAIDNATTRHDLQLTLWESARGLEGAFTYSTDLFEARTIAGIAEQFKNLAGLVAENPDISLSALRTATRNKLSAATEEISRQKLKSTRRKVVAPTSMIKESLLRADVNLPLVIEAAVDALSLSEWTRNNRDSIVQKLRNHGAILFRGFNVSSVEEFEQFLRLLAGGDLLEYSYRSTPRSEVSGRIYTSTEYPAHQSIPLHNEMSYTREWPGMLGFFCIEAASEGGETPIADSRRVLNLIAPAIKERFISKGVMYVRNYGEALDLPWQNVFQTNERAEVEDYCRKSGIEFEWKHDVLRTSQVCQAVANHPHTGEMVWFNQAHLFHISSLESQVRESLSSLGNGEPPRNAYYGDGTPINESDLEHIREVYTKEAVVFGWQKQDILVLDNMLAAHGRRPFRGSRKLVVGMG